MRTGYIAADCEKPVISLIVQPSLNSHKVFRKCNCHSKLYHLYSQKHSNTQSSKKLPEFSSRKRITTQICLEILTEVLGKDHSDQVHTDYRTVQAQSSQFVRVCIMAFLKFLAHANMRGNFCHATELD